MEDFFDFEKLKAKVYLLSEGDQKNRAMVSSEHLLVVRKGVKHLYALKRITKIETGIKKSLLPLFLGGIFTPFALLSYFTNMFQPLVHLIATLLGMFLFYIGWSGRATLTIKLSNNLEEHILLPVISNNLLAFIDFVQGLINGKNRSSLTGMIFFEEDKTGIFSGEDDSSVTFPIAGYTYQQIIKLQKTGENLIAIDPENARREVKFIFDTAINEMRPTIDGPVDRNAESKEFRDNFNINTQ